MSELFLKIVNMSISASWLVLAVLILRLALKKAPKWVNVLLWGIVAIRLVCPFSLESAFSLIPSAETIPLSIGMNTAPTINSGIKTINNTINPIISRSNTPAAGDSANPLQIALAILEGVWGLGMLAMALFAVISYWRLHRRVDTAVRCRDHCFQSENVRSPFVMGIVKPKIYLPFKLNGQALEYVIAHEQAHIRRGDHLWKPLGFLLLTIHWFNPLMWLAYVLLCRDIELACDERVIRALGNAQRADYTQALVLCSVNRRKIAACPLAFGEVGVKERVKSVMNYKKPAFWVVLLAVVICVGAAVCFLTNPKKESHTLKIVVPAGNQAEFVYSDEEIRSVNGSVRIWLQDGLNEARILLVPVSESTGAGYAAVNLADGVPVEFEAEKDVWFKVGVNAQSAADEERIISVRVENAEIRISDKTASDRVVFDAEILEIQDGYFLVKPESDSAIDADPLEVPMENMYSGLEPQAGDTIEIIGSGEILETYPARLSKVYGIRVIEKADRGEGRNDQPAKSEIPEEMRALLGSWQLDAAYTEKCNGGLSLREILGTSLDDYGAALRLSADGTIEYRMGSVSGKGLWYADGDTGRYLAEVTTYPDAGSEVLTFCGFKESPDAEIYLVLDYAEYALYWVLDGAY